MRPHSHEKANIKLRRFLNKNEWSVRLLNLPRSDAPASDPGLVLIQIDGLSRQQLLAAVRAGRMPFLKRLMDAEDYRLCPHYPGLPASTPSVQAELFYGVKQALPAFSFLDHEQHQVFKMYNGDNARAVEERLKKQGQGLLTGGTSYSNVYAGGAAEYHYCAVNLGWPQLLKNARLVRRLLFVLLHILEITAVLFLMAWETLIAFYDFLTGVTFDKNIVKELKFIPTRPLFCILLRELVTLGVKLDMARGFPVIHANFLGYDEQAHRRGPSSRFAHWTLKGIDGAIERIYREALQTSRRHYDVWIYSDHGQEDVASYIVEYGQNVTDAVEEAFAELRPSFFKDQDRKGIQTQRLRYFNHSWLNRTFLQSPDPGQSGKADGWTVTAIGPTGNIYAPLSLSFPEKAALARKLVRDAHIPVVAVNEKKDGDVHVWTAEGEVLLSRDPGRIFGADHPYRDELSRDFASLTQHPDAGDFTICGWRPGRKPLSFAVENGSHAGPGQGETDAFALLPKDALSLKEGRRYVRTADLRTAALQYLKRQDQPQKPFHGRSRKEKKALRVMTYNVHSCIGMDGHLSPERIARVIARHEPDIIALQELDMQRSRTESVDQPQVIARHLGMSYHFHPSMRIEKEQYGNAILSRYPLEVVSAGSLPVPRRGRHEVRGVLWVKVEVDGTQWQVFNTHLGLNPDERMVQIQALLSDRWLNNPACRGPVVLCGDLNAWPNSKVMAAVRQSMRDTAHRRRIKTWMSQLLIGQLDYIFTGPGITSAGTKTSRTDLDRVASDHLPLIADLVI